MWMRGEIGVSYSIRTAQPADFVALIALFESVRAGAGWLLPAVEPIGSPTFAQLTEGERIDVAEDSQGALLGFVSVHANSPNTARTAAANVCLNRISLCPDHRLLRHGGGPFRHAAAGVRKQDHAGGMFTARAQRCAAPPCRTIAPEKEAMPSDMPMRAESKSSSDARRGPRYVQRA